MRVQDHLLRALGDFELNADGTLITESSAKLEVEDGDIIIDGLDVVWKGVTVESSLRSHVGAASNRFSGELGFETSNNGRSMG